MWITKNVTENYTLLIANIWGLQHFTPHKFYLYKIRDSSMAPQKNRSKNKLLSWAGIWMHIVLVVGKKNKWSVTTDMNILQSGGLAIQRGIVWKWVRKKLVYFKCCCSCTIFPIALNYIEKAYVSASRYGNAC